MTFAYFKSSQDTTLASAVIRNSATPDRARYCNERMAKKWDIGFQHNEYIDLYNSKDLDTLVNKLLKAK